VEEAEREGIEFHYLSAPQQVVLGPEGACVGIECLATSLGEPDESGRRRPLPVPGSEFVLEADLIIAAVGQTPDLSFLGWESPELNPNGTLKVDPVTYATSLAGVFAGGDVVTGPSTVVEALAAGRRAALSIDRYLHGASLEEWPVPTTIPYEAVDADMFKPHAREEMPSLPAAERAGSFKEVELGFDVSAAQREVVRCFQCGLFPKK
jgi:NADPH-dependent glutamate synthase beta subunit-like oxidoreductase